MTFCPSKEDITKQVCALFPRGRAWENVDNDGSYLNRVAKGLAGGFEFAEQRVCDMLAELFCSTAVETVDQWQADYGLPDECDPHGQTLCGKVGAYGGTTCDYFVDVAAGMGWVITCEDLSQQDVHITGCTPLGFIPLGPPGVLNEAGSTLGKTANCACDFGSAVEHPDTDFWEAGKPQANASCPVPGSRLGHAQLGPQDSCCSYVGYFDGGNTIEYGTTNCSFFEIDSNVIEGNCTPSALDSAVSPHCIEDTAAFEPYVGFAHRWKVTVDVPASLTLQESLGQTPQSWTQAGCTPVGCEPLCRPHFDDVLCFLERVKPAHTVLESEFIYI